MAENEENEQPLISANENPDAAEGKGEGTAKKATKKRAAKKKVVKKRAVTKKVVTKKTAAKAAPTTNTAIAQDTGQRAADTNAKEEGSVAVDAAVVAGEPSDAGKSGAREQTPAMTGPSELPREEKVTMSAEASNTAKSSAAGGFGIKVVISIIVVLAAFMYVRSLAHKGQPVKRSESSVPASVSQTAGVTKTTAIKQSRSNASSTAADQSPGLPSAVAKVGAVAVEKETEPARSPAGTQPSAVPVVPVQVAVSGAIDTDASSAQQTMKEAESAVQSEVSSPIPVFVPTQTSEVESEPASTGRSGPAQSADSATIASDQVTATAPSETADAQSEIKAKSSDVAVVSQQKSPSASVVPAPQLPEAVRGTTTADSTSAVVAEKSAVSTPVATEAIRNIESSDVAGSADTEASPTALPQAMQGRDFASHTKRRPSFKELFGYERPRPPVQRQDYGAQGGPYTTDSYEPQGFYPAPWQHAPMQPAWGAEYPGQYGPYGNYGGYPAYPGMPEWAPYQPYGYAPPGY